MISPVQVKNKEAFNSSFNSFTDDDQLFPADAANSPSAKILVTTAEDFPGDVVWGEQADDTEKRKVTEDNADWFSEAEPGCEGPQSTGDGTEKKRLRKQKSKKEKDSRPEEKATAEEAKTVKKEKKEKKAKDSDGPSKGDESKCERKRSKTPVRSRTLRTGDSSEASPPENKILASDGDILASPSQKNSREEKKAKDSDGPLTGDESKRERKRSKTPVRSRTLRTGDSSENSEASPPENKILASDGDILASPSQKSSREEKKAKDSDGPSPGDESKRERKRSKTPVGRRSRRTSLTDENSEASPPENKILASDGDIASPSQKSSREEKKLKESDGPSPGDASKRERKRSKTPVGRRSRRTLRIEASSETSPPGNQILASEGDVLASPVQKTAREQMIEKAKEQVKLQMSAGGSKTGVRVRVTVRKKSKDGELGSPVRTPGRASPRRKVMIPVKVPFGPAELEEVTTSPTKSDRILQRALSRNQGEEKPSLDSHLSTKSPSRRGRRSCVSLSGSGFNHMDNIVSSPTPLIGDETPKTPRRRDVLHREDRLRSEKEWGGVVDDIRNRREISQKEEVAIVSSPTHTSPSLRAPARKTSYSNLDNCPEFKVSPVARSRSSDSVALEVGAGNYPRRIPTTNAALIASMAKAAADAEEAQKKMNSKSRGRGLFGGGKKQKETEENPVVVKPGGKAPGRSKSFGFKSLG
jgi:hypothetical protein